MSTPTAKKNVIKERGRLKKAVAAALTVLVMAGVFWGCASAPAASPEEPERATYRGVGRGDSLASAMAGAKIDAIRNAVIDMIGPAAEERNRPRLDDALYSTRNPNAFLYTETMNTIRRENLGSIDSPEMVYEMTVEVNRDAIRRVLRAQGVLEGEGGAGSRAQELVEGENRDVRTPANPDGSAEADRAGGPSDRAAGGTDEIALSAELDRELTEEERRFIQRYIRSMTYMVYFEESEEIDPFVLKSGVTQANSYLTRQGQQVVDPDQVERLREDRTIVLEQESSTQASAVLWVAERLDADIYIELGARTNSESQGSRHYATANVALRMFETSTGRLLGAVNRQSQRTFSPSSAEDAVLNATQSAVYQAMPDVFEQARRQMARYVSEGVRYELVVQSTPDARALSRFRGRLAEEVESIETVSQAAEQTVYRVNLFGELSDLEEYVYETADTVPGFEGLYLVLKRGKSITVNTGM